MFSELQEFVWIDYTTKSLDNYARKFCVNLTQARAIREEESATEKKMPSWDWAIVKHVVHLRYDKGGVSVL